MQCGLTLIVFDIDKSDRKLFRRATQPGGTIFSLLKPPPTVLISFIRGNIHTCFPLFNIRSLKTLTSFVYLNMYNPLIVILCFLFLFFLSSLLHVFCFVFYILCILCISLIFTL